MYDITIIIINFPQIDIINLILVNHVKREFVLVCSQSGPLILPWGYNGSELTVIWKITLQIKYKI